MNTNRLNQRQANNRRRKPNPSLFRMLTPRESREARRVAYEAALAVIG